MDAQQIISIIIFVVTMAAIMTEKVHRALAAVAGATLLLACKILEKVRLIKFAESLGGVETLITYPVTQTHADVPEDIREANGITDCTLRLSVGIESGRDLIADLERAFAGAKEEI